ncbi:hypothetical protein AYO44_17995 [Planctomycetaceae bacterium SCGC AG-212-F19]|nr:hypothetical protein AYO44_17995 [Planctomycetaceae bacterium SCGC AG-212-F19]
MRSFPSIKVRRHRKHKRSRRHTRTRTRGAKPQVELGQSWLGTLALFFGLLGLFALSVQGIVWIQAHHGAPGAMRLIITWLARAETLTGIAATILALLSFPFSARRQRNAVFGFLLGVIIIGTWIWLENWRWVL